MVQITLLKQANVSQKSMELGKCIHAKIEQKPNGFCSSPTSLVIAVSDLLKKIRLLCILIVLKSMWLRV